MSQYEHDISEIISQVQRTNADTVFGASRTVGDEVLIPVAQMVYGAGGGGGKGKGKNPEEQEGEGSGIGMGANVKPLGFIDISPQGMRYHPIIDYNHLLAMLLPMLTLMVFRLLKKSLRRRA